MHEQEATSRSVRFGSGERGGAIRQHGGIPTSRLGKAIAKQRKMHARGECIQTTRIVKRGKWLV